MRELVPLAITALVLATGPAFAQKATITDQDCRQIVAHVASSDVNYKPGVDVYGHKVAPADLPGSSQIQPPQNFTIDANIDLHKFGVPNSSPLLLPSANVGKITVEDGGRRVYFNGQPLGDTDQRALADYCREQQSKQKR